MGDELTGAVVGAIVAELLSAVLKAKDISISDFEDHFDRLKCTLESLLPRIWEAEKLSSLTDSSHNGMLTRRRQKDMRELLQQLKNGKELIDECSKVPYWNLWKRHTCCKRMQELDTRLLRFAQINTLADIWVDTKKLLLDTRELHKKLENQHEGLIGGDDININNSSYVDTDLPSVSFDSGLPSEELSRREMLLNCMVEAHDLEGVSFKRLTVPEAEQAVSKRAKLTETYLTRETTIRREVESDVEMLLKQKDDTITRLMNENSQLFNSIANSYSNTKMHLTYTCENASTSRTLQEVVKEKRIIIPGLIEFPIDELVMATDGFNASRLIGIGGFGGVYKGKLRFTEVAIKRLSSGSTQGASEFEQEVYILSRMRHPHIVTLVGSCLDSFCLVYEFLNNGSLENHLSGRVGRAPLSWKIRSRIAAQICSALAFLHAGSVVHGDLKPANILLDNNFGAKISDLGMSHFLTDKTEETMYVLTCVKGTVAYIDPEFLATRMLTFKSDVYAYGLIILRLLTGKGALGMVEEVQQAMSAGLLDQILDREAGDWPFQDAMRLAELGLHCCEVNRMSRPSMEEVWDEVQSYM